MAADRPIALPVGVALAVLLGLVHGQMNGAEMTAAGIGIVGLVGTVGCLFVLVSLVTGSS